MPLLPLIFSMCISMALLLHVETLISCMNISQQRDCLWADILIPQVSFEDKEKELFEMVESLCQLFLVLVCADFSFWESS
jgi:hypothetical protein